jgi:hypothetical protein
MLALAHWLHFSMTAGKMARMAAVCDEDGGVDSGSTLSTFVLI